MIKRAMSVIRAAVKRLNPEEITLNQPLYAIVKTIQWVFRDTHKEDKYVLLMGGFTSRRLHLRYLLRGSEWVEALTEAGIFTSVVAASCLTCTN
jgi:hypothetical protein